MKVFFLIILSLFFINFISASGVISTTSGDVTGTLKRGVILYEDIPYAEAPVGNLRWKAPRRIENKVKIYPKENNFCIQRPSNLGGVEGKDFFVGSEDCLYLDIFAPKKNK